MHAAKLTLSASTGVPLARWGNELTVLLEKMFGNIYIDKMRTICLLEANYNWLNKFVFPKQMMDKSFRGISSQQNSFQKGDHRQQRGY
jgi:hypothetical protein